MVRVVSQNFSPPRSRHSSGETDRDLAERANLALSSLGRKKSDMPEYESSSDSFWDSELDGDQFEAAVSEKNGDINGNESGEKSLDVQSKRKERRRERNKLSAQAYRQRRRSQSVKEQQTLMQLEAENKRLHKLVDTLEKKTEHAKHILRGCTHPMPLQPIGELEGATADMSDTDADMPGSRSAAPQPVPSTSSQMHTCPIRGAVNLLPSSNLTLPTPSFINKFSLSPVKNEPHPIFSNNNTPNFTYPNSVQPTPTICPTLQHGQLIFNTNVLIGATLSPSGVANLTAVPAILAVPIENKNHIYPNSNLNCNPLRTSPAAIPTTTDPLVYPDKETCHTKHEDDTPSVFNAVWWGGNQVEPHRKPVAGTIVGLVNMGMCNNSTNTISNNASDANGNSNCDKNISMPCHPNSQPVSFNLNLNQPAGATCQEMLCQDQIQTKHPAMPIQCYLASGDQVQVQ